MDNFSFYIPTRFEFGRGAELKVGEMIRALGGTRVLVHYGSGSAVKSGLIGRVLGSLDAAGLQHVELGGALPNPRDDKVYEGIQLGRSFSADFILAVGGGSAIDSCKAIAAGIPYEGDFWDFFSGAAVPQKVVKLGVVLTMAAAGSESSNSCVIMQKATLTKRGLNVELNRPQFALMNPELTYTLPPYQTACGATDIMAHVLERYFTNTTDVDVTDRLCEALLLTVIRAAKQALKSPRGLRRPRAADVGGHAGPQQHLRRGPGGRLGQPPDRARTQRAVRRGPRRRPRGRTARLDALHPPPRSESLCATCQPRVGLQPGSCAPRNAPPSRASSASRTSSAPSECR